MTSTHSVFFQGQIDSGLFHLANYSRETAVQKGEELAITMLYSAAKSKKTLFTPYIKPHW
jgi:hypothetical protein